MSVEKRADFSYIRYSNCWEDAAVLTAGLNLSGGDTHLSITSAGDNSLALLAHGPERVVSLDINPAQTALAALKKSAFRIGSHDDFLRFLGFRQESATTRIEMYRSIADNLPPEVREYWNGRDDEIAGGVIHLGKFERYFTIFRRFVLPLVHRRKRVEALLQPRDLDNRREFYRDHWDRPSWRAIFGLFFSRSVMGRLGRDPEFFRHVDGPVSRRIRRRTEYALTELSVAENPFVRYILTGSFQNALPEYARPESFTAIRDRLDHLELVTGDLPRVIAGEKFDGMNLSDIFEYMTPSETGEVASMLVDRLRPGGRIVYWEMLAERDIATMHPERLERLDRRSERLHNEDRAFFYQRLHVMEKRTGASND